MNNINDDFVCLLFAAPMRGIPNKTPISGGFMRSTSTLAGARGFGSSTPLGNRAPANNRKEGGIKVGADQNFDHRDVEFTLTSS